MKIKLLILMILILSVNALFGQVGYNEEFLINSKTDEFQNNLKTVVLSDGKYVVCWESRDWGNDGQDGDRFGIIAQIFNKDCIKFGSEFIVNTYTRKNQFNHQIASFVDGNFIICWESEYQDASNLGVFAQVFTNNGDKIGEEFRISEFEKGAQKNVQVHTFSNNRCIIVWQDGSDCYNVNYVENNQTRDGWKGSIYAQIFNSQGEELSTEIQINDDYKYNDTYPSIHKINEETVLVTWQRDGSNTSGIEVFGKLYKKNGEKISNEFQINSHTDRLQYKPKPKAIGNDNGNFIVFWESNKSSVGEGYQICGQAFHSDGEKSGSEFNLSTYTNGCRDHQLLKTGNSEFIIIWDHGSWCIKAQKMNIEGRKIGEEKILSKKGQYYYVYRPLMKRINEENYLLLSYKSSGQSKFLCAQFIDSDFNKIGEEFVVNNNSDRWLYSFDLINLEDEKFVVCYELYSRYYRQFSNLYSKYYINYPLEHDLENFEIIYPEMDRTIHDRIPIFNWQKANDEKNNIPWEFYYDLYISENEDFSNPKIYSNIDTTSFKIPDTLDIGTAYYWKVQAVNWTYDSLWSSNVNGFFVSNDAEVAVDNEPMTTTEFTLHQNYPNPFNPTTMINYQLPINSEVKLVIFNNLGEKVATLVDDNQQAGNYSINFDATGLSSGIYFYQIVVGNPSIASGQGYVETKKMIYCK